MRFIGFFWNRENEAQQRSAGYLMRRLRERFPENTWQQPLKQDGAAVYYAGRLSRAKDCYLLDRNSGVVFGALFKSHRDLNDDSAAPRAKLGPGESAKIIVSGGRELVTGYWGNYVAFLTNPTERKSWILSGPFNSLALKAAQFEGVTIYFSDLQDLLQLNVFSFSIDYRQIAAVLAGAEPAGKTALNEVTEILMGQCVEWSRGKEYRSFYWHPLNFTTKDAEITRVDEAIRAVRSVVRSCVRTRESCYDDILVALSGGVDSSIVLASMQRTAARVRCFTHYSDARMEDERPFGQAMALKANSEWYEMKRTLNTRYEEVLTRARLSASPGIYFESLQLANAESIPPDLLSAEAVFTGSGGDEVFLRYYQRHCISDLIYRRRLSRSLFREAMHAAIKDGQTIWRVLGEAAYNAFIPHPVSFGAEAFQFRRLMRKELLEDIQRSGACKSIWFRSSRDAPPGKLHHIHIMVRPSGGGTLVDSTWQPHSVEPLRSQQVVELALRIPTDLIWLGGKERGLALEAFKEDLTYETLHRTWKGGITTHHTNIFRKNARFIEDIITDSPLIRERVLERDQVRQSLSDVLAGNSAHASEILSATDAAIFVFLWENSGYLRRSSSASSIQFPPKLAVSDTQ